MKIPIYEPMNVAPRPAQLQARAVTRQDFGALEKGTEELGQAGAQTLATGEKLYDQYAAKEAADGVTELQKAHTDLAYGTTTPAPVDYNAPVQDVSKMSTDEFSKFLEGQPAQQTPGFLATRGDAAAAGIDPYLKDLADQRKKIRDGLNSDRARDLYDKATENLMTQAYQQAHAHTAEQLKVALEDTGKDNLAQSLRDVAKDPSNDSLANDRVGNSAAIVEKLSTSRADAEAKMNAVRAEIASTRLDVLLERGTTTDLESARRVFDESKGVLGEHRFAHYEGLLNKRDDSADEAVLATKLVRSAVREDGSLDEGKLYQGIAEVAEKAPKKLKGVHDAVTEQSTLVRKAYSAGTENLMASAQSAFNQKGWMGMPPELKDQLNARKYDERAPKLYDTLYAEFLRRSKMGRESKSQQQKDQLALIADAVNDFNGYPDDIKATMDLGPTGQFAQEHPGLLHAVEGVPDGLKKLKPLQQQSDARLQKGESAPLERMISQTVSELSKGGEGAYLAPGRTPQEKLEYQRRLKDVRSQAIESWTDAATKGPPSQSHADEMTARIVLSHGIANKVQGAAAARAAVTLGAPKPPAPRRQLSFGDRLKQLQAQKVSREQARKIMEAEGFDLKTGSFRTAAPAPIVAPEPDEDTPPIPGED